MRIALPIVIALVLGVYALIDCLQTDPADVRGPRRAIWLALIAALPVIGPVTWLVARFGQRRQGRPPRPGPRPLAPDDNPDFLREIGDVDAEHQKMLEQWEADLRRREEEMRHRPEGDDDIR